jgi:hypothetical protein
MIIRKATKDDVKTLQNLNDEVFVDNHKYVPTPQQLENSIRALIPLNPGDPRIKRYQSEMPEAKERVSNWRDVVERIKKI